MSRGGSTAFDPDRLLSNMKQRWRGPDGARAARIVALLEGADEPGPVAESATGPAASFDLDAAVQQMRRDGRVRQNPTEPDRPAPMGSVPSVVFRAPGVKPDRRAMAQAGDLEGLEQERRDLLLLIGWSDEVDFRDSETWPLAARYVRRPFQLLDMVRRPLSGTVQVSYLLSMVTVIEELEAGHMASQEAG